MKKIRILAIICLSACWVTPALAALKLKNVITGIKEKPALRNAQKRLKINQTFNNKALTIPEINMFFEQGPHNIKEAIAPYGYFASTVKAKLSNKGDNWTASYTVDPGPLLKITIANIRIIGEGNLNKHINNVFKHLPLKAGEIFTAKHYEDSKDLLLDTAETAGYIDAKFVIDKITIDRSAYTCVIDLTLDTGSRYYFGNITFSKNPISVKLLQRYVPFKIGSPYSTDKLINFQSLLSHSGYFKSVVVTPEKTKANAKKQVPVQVDLAKNHKKYYRFGVGYGTGTGPRISAGINWRWVNQYGHKFSLNTQLSRISNALSAQYLIPGKNPTTDQYTITGTRFTLRPYKHQISFGNRLTLADTFKWGLWQQTYQTDLLSERYRFDDKSDYRRAHAIIPGLTWSRVSAKNILKVKKGSMFSMNWRGASNHFLSSVNFLQTDWKYKWIHPLFSKNFRIVLRGELGYTFIARKNIQKLPLSLQFHAGGIYTLRGFAYSSIGPGRYLMTGSGELQRRIIGNLWAGTFIDEGDAFNFFSPTLQRGVGFSLIYQSPVGPIAVSIAQAQTKRGRPWKFQFSIGPEL